MGDDLLPKQLEDFQFKWHVYRQSGGTFNLCSSSPGVRAPSSSLDHMMSSLMENFGSCLTER